MTADPTVQFREIRRSDLSSFDQLFPQAIGNLERSTGMDELALALFKSLHNPAFWTLLKILQAIGRLPFKMFVAVDHGRVVGCAAVIMLQKSGYVNSVATDSQARNHGIATHLLELIHQEVQRGQKEWAVLDVESENETAIRLYRKLGYQTAVEFGWFVGPLPEVAVGGNGVSPVAGSQMAEVATWVNRNMLASMAGPVPASKGKLSYVETIIRGPRTPIKTWRLAQSGRTQAVVRVCYFDRIKTGFLLPLAFDAVPTSEPLTSLFTPAFDWIRASGGTKVVVTFPLPSRGLEKTMETMKLPRVVSSTLMVRPSQEKPA